MVAAPGSHDVDSGSVAFRPRTTVQAELGEGARWDAAAAQLLSVDLLRGEVFVWDVPADDAAPLHLAWQHQIDEVAGAVTPVDGDDGWVLAYGRGVGRLGRDGSLVHLRELAGAGHRVNDAACDSAGRLFVGTLALDLTTGAGTVMRVDPDGSVTQVLTGFTITNGIAWSLDESTMYVVDSIPGVVWAYEYDSATGVAGERRELLRLSGIGGPDGTPDGLTVDAGGDLWIACYDGACVLRVDGDGAIRERLAVAAEQVTSVCFGGPDLTTIFATTATEYWDDARRAAHPEAGLIHSRPAPSGVVGLPARPFRPTGQWWPRPRV